MPQVIAATAPIGPVSVQIGTLVKLVRVLMLGPVVLILSLATRGGAEDGGVRRLSMTRLVPWFILGFLAMVAVRTTGLVPHAVLAPAGAAANLLTVVAMAALGLSVDVRTVAEAGVRVTSVVVLSLLALGGISLAFIFLIAAH